MTGEIGRKHFVIILENSLQEFSCITCCKLPDALYMFSRHSPSYSRNG